MMMKTKGKLRRLLGSDDSTSASPSTFPATFRGKIKKTVRYLLRSDDPASASTSTSSAALSGGSHVPSAAGDNSKAQTITAVLTSPEDRSGIIVPDPQHHASPSPLKPVGEKAIDQASATEGILDAPTPTQAISPESGSVKIDTHHPAPSPSKTAAEEAIGGPSAAENVGAAPSPTAEAISPAEGSGITVPDPQYHASPSPSDTVWEEVIKNLEHEDRNELNLGELENLKSIDEFLKDIKNNQQELQNMICKNQKETGDVGQKDTADRFLNNVKTFVEIGDITVQSAPQPVSAVWLVFRFLLKIALNDREITSNILSDMEHISRILARCAVYQELYTDRRVKSVGNLLEQLPDLYTVILLYLCRTKRYYSRKSGKRKVAATLDPYNTEFLPLMEDIKKQEASVENAARAAADYVQAKIADGVKEMSSEQQKAAADLKKLQKLLQSIQEETKDKLQSIFKKLEDVERTEILRWLSNVTYGAHHEFVKSRRQPDTGSWLFDKKHYIDWRQCASSAIFWLHGSAGVGKTTLASLVIDIVRETKSTNDAIAYFYCKDGESDRQDPESIMRCIVKQLSLAAPEGSLPKPVLSTYRKHKTGGFEFGQLPLGESGDLILQLSKPFGQIVIVMDALDECKKDTRMQLIKAFKALRSSTDRLKIFFTSRDDDDISFALGGEQEIYIQPSDNSGDIELFVRAEVEKFIEEDKLLGKSLKLDLKQHIVDTLIKGADGMFQWVRLQLDTISLAKSESGIRNALKSLPKGLKNTYSVIWDRIDSDIPENRLLAERVLKWIICARSPLTSKQILDAVSVQPMQWAEKPNHDCVTVPAILAVCQNLVVVDQKLDVLRPAHFSVTEFLKQKFTLDEAHTAAAEVCLTLLCCENHASENRRADKNILDNYTLADYVTRNWMEHLRLSGDGSETLATLRREFLKPSAAYSTWLRIAAGRDYGLWQENAELTPFWIVCYYKLWGIFQEQLDITHDYNICNYYGRTALHLIARYEYGPGLTLLLQKESVDPNSKDNDGKTPLHHAASEGSKEVVELLLARGDVDPSAKDNDGKTPLHHAAGRRSKEVVELLLAREDVDPSDKDKYGKTPLLFALQEWAQWNRLYEWNILHDWSEEEVAVVKLFLARRDFDLKMKDDGGETLLNHAAKWGSKEVVELLLARGDVVPKSNALTR